MAKTNVAAFAQSPKTATAVVTAAATNTGTDTPTGVVTLFTAGPDGAIMTRLTAIPRASVSASALLLYLSSSADSYATQRLIDSETMPLQNITTGAGIGETTFANYSEARPGRLAPGDRIGVASALSVNVVFKAEYTDF